MARIAGVVGSPRFMSARIRAASLTDSEPMEALYPVRRISAKTFGLFSRNIRMLENSVFQRKSQNGRLNPALKARNHRLYFAKFLPLVIAAAGLPVFAQAPGAVDSTESVMRIAPHQHAPIRIKERHDDGTSTSTNWSGYAVAASKDAVTSVKASWKVPAATCNGSGPKTGYAAFWVGIDGYNSNSVEQIGTDSDCSSGSPVYYSWYEFYPAPSYETTMSIESGDIISASVTYSSSEFTVKITDERTGQSFTKSKAVSTAKRSSAEWIAEAPSTNTGVLPLSDFGTVFFGDDSTGIAGTNYATISGQTLPIGGFSSSSVQEITMETSGGSVEAKPTALSSDKTSFSVQWY
jgi:hypothetical protein